MDISEAPTMGTFGVRADDTFRLYEGLLWEPERGYFLLDRHLERLRHSAEHFGFVFDEGDVEIRLRTFAGFLDDARKVRLELSADGSLFIEDVDVKPPVPVTVDLASEPVDSVDEYLRHKSSHRSVYDRAMAASDAQDVILWNERGELTETCTANLVLRIGGRLLTPALSSGLLPGTFRAALVERGQIEEAVLPCEALAKADELYLINSVRRWCALKLEREGATAHG